MSAKIEEESKLCKFEAMPTIVDGGAILVPLVLTALASKNTAAQTGQIFERHSYKGKQRKGPQQDQRPLGVESTRDRSTGKVHQAHSEQAATAAPPPPAWVASGAASRATVSPPDEGGRGKNLGYIVEEAVEEERQSEDRTTGALVARVRANHEFFEEIQGLHLFNPKVLLPWMVFPLPYLLRGLCGTILESVSLVAQENLRENQPASAPAPANAGFYPRGGALPWGVSCWQNASASQAK